MGKDGMNIVLIGYRAAGKSTLGNLLAQKLGWPLLDIDRGIEAKTGQTLKNLYEESGEEIFRDIESRVVHDMCSQDNHVIAFGAGSLTRPENQVMVRQNALVVYLYVPPEVLWDRIQNDPQSADTRPNLTRGGFQEVVEMLSQRDPIYRKCADLILDGTRPSQDLCEEIFAAYLAHTEPA